MPRFYFDFEDGGTTIDDDGMELPDLDAAIKEAIIAIGQHGTDFTRDGSEGRIVVRVRKIRALSPK